MRIPRAEEVRGLLAEGCRQLLEKPVYSGAISLFGAGVKLAGLKDRKADSKRNPRRHNLSLPHIPMEKKR